MLSSSRTTSRARRAGSCAACTSSPGRPSSSAAFAGAILDVLVDIRRGSPSFGHWEGFQLDDTEHHQLFVPDGFAHGFCVLTDVADVAYKTSAYYDPELEGGFAFNDPGVAIKWPADQPLIASQRDRSAPTLAELEPTLPFDYAPPA